MKTEFKRIEDLVIEINSVSDNLTETKEEQIRTEGDYFYSRGDNKVHKSTEWISYYYYDEKHKSHPHELVYKVVATSDNKKYPELPLLTVLDLAREK